jgi:hypothetical protein
MPQNLTDRPVSADEVRAELDRVLQSPAFQRSERLQKFLHFVCELTLKGEGSRINEYPIGSEVIRLYLLHLMDEFDHQPRKVHGTAVIEPRRPRSLTPESLHDLIQRRAPEVEELLVHALDFMYFYGSNPSDYVMAIWESWQSLPRLESRLSEYLLRTIAAVSVRHIDAKDWQDKAKSDTRAGLDAVVKELGTRSYAHRAITFLDSDPTGTLNARIATRAAVFRIAYGFLQTPNTLASVRRDLVYPARAERASPDRFVGQPIHNPLQFVADHTAQEADAFRSFWMLQRLAFDTVLPTG